MLASSGIDSDRCPFGPDDDDGIDNWAYFRVREEPLATLRALLA
jgi:hypothetical protein